MEMISAEKREKYRNPPAHTRYLPYYYIALEAREFVLQSLENLKPGLIDFSILRKAGALYIIL